MLSRLMKYSICSFSVLLCVGLLIPTGNAKEKSEATLTKQEAEKLFSLRIHPLLKSKCLACHGEKPGDLQGEFDVRTRESLIKGGESEEASLIPLHPESSPLFQAIKWEDGLEMPPKENDRLTPKEIEYFQKWIAGGAPWPSEEEQAKHVKAYRMQKENADGILYDTSGGTSDAWTFRRYQKEDLWAFQPVKKPDVPKGARHPIDAFINKKMDEKSVKPAPKADAKTLIRRASYDLIGLPPKPEDVSKFEKDYKANPDLAWRVLIEDLLASPHYGERWGQHWLDVVRYADTTGYANDYEKSNTWRYRDYVIRAFNNDKPYNEFVMEQLAGDEIDPKNPEMLVAASFLRMGSWGTAMVEQKVARQLWLDDVVNGVGQAFLSTAMRCCKCHDHKFDPLPTRDYYSMYATFATTQLAERPAPFLEDENKIGFEENKKEVAMLKKIAVEDKNRILKIQEEAAKKWYIEHNLPYKNLNERKNVAEEMKPERHVGLDHTNAGTLKVREQDEWIWNRRLERFQPMANSVYNGSDTWQNARKLRIKPLNKKWNPENYILSGGALEAKGDKVTPSVLSALGLPTDTATKDAPYKLPESIEGRRLGLAKWIAHPENQLATRSIVNRIWQYHFGVGLAANSNNFGVKGQRPTHPELLDWMTSVFVEKGWSIKYMHRMIMASEAYQRSCEHPENEKLQNLDPNNHLLAKFVPRRLTAEEIRDTMLFVTGELQTEMGGLPVRPEMNMEVALQPRMIQFSLAPAYLPSRTPEQRNRRSIYAYRVRGQSDPFMELFNLPNPNESCELRDSAAVTPQAFTMMNSEMTSDRSIALALRVQKEKETSNDQIARAFELTFGRLPSEKEQTALTKYHSEMIAYHETHMPAPSNYPTEITRSLVEEFSGKPFKYQEKLPVFESYIPDKKPSDVDAKTRALADACLLLLNSNEFVYVY